MLKRPDPSEAEPDSLSDLFGRARDDGKAWAMAEVALYRTIATERAKAWQTPLVLLGAALFLGHAALLVLVATLFVALAQVMNPALAGLVSMILLAASAAILVNLAVGKIKAIGK
ncbi:MAG: phage holin family protein [Sphingomicrobium sp.]